MEAGNFKDALNLLDKSLNMNYQLEGQEHISNCDILILISQVWFKRKEFDKALEALRKILSIADSLYGPENEQSATALVEIAKIHAKKQDLE
jgi:tetratricopeptide (TPR) repeat protein